MEVKFIGQGLSLPTDKPAGDVINEILESHSYNEFAAFVAFARKGGLNMILPKLKKFIENGGKVRLYIGVDMHATSKEALQMLMNERIPTYIVHSPNTITYHPKIYTFEGDSKFYIIVGSSNLTTSGLYQNVEASLCVSNEYENDEGRELLSDIYDYYNSFLNGQSTSCAELTEEVLEKLVNAKTVLPEKTVNEYNKKQNKDISTAKLSDIKALNETFAKLKIRSPKNQKDRKVNIEIMEAGESDIMVHSSSADISANCMWIETKEMTGGSRNILDLSANGKRENVEKPGSVEFFGVDKNDHNQRIDINLVYNGKVYVNNTILWAPRNNNWRLQLKGESSDNSKMTDISKSRLGEYGGFQRKILIFEKTDIRNQFNLLILDETEIDNMIALSSDWARGGHGTGRAYGYINPSNE